MPRWNVDFNMRFEGQNPEVVKNVAMAHALSRVIRSIPITPDVRDKLDALNIMRAVRGTTGIEGIELSEDEVRQIMEASGKQHVLSSSRSREEREVQNAQKVMSFVVNQLTEIPDTPLTESIIRKIHDITTKNINYPRNIPGRYRSHDVQAGTYLPPEASKVRGLMRDFIDWFNNGSAASWDPIVRAFVAHFFVISIHPFGDGNGRTARGVESFLLYKAGVNARGFYSLANFFYRRRPEYVEILDHVRFETNGDLTPFVLFALKGLVSELEEVHNEVLDNVKIIAYRDFAQERLRLTGKLGTSAGVRLLRFISYISHGESVSLKSIRAGEHKLSALYGKMTAKTLSRDIQFLRHNELIIVNGDELRANLDIMTRYTPPFEIVA